MRVSGILASKGATVTTISPQASVADVADVLRLRGVGALVVSTDGRHIEGIITERDVVCRLAERGELALSESVTTVMNDQVRTCAPEDHAEELMRLMTEHRIRHLPVEAKSADGTVHWGVGLHESILTASLRAVVSAVNRHRELG